jgi:flagellar assembly factor FliW
MSLEELSPSIVKIFRFFQVTSEGNIKENPVSKKKNSDVILGLTPYQGELLRNVDQNSVFIFPDGVPAFEDAHQFSIITTDDIKPFLYLKSLDIEELGFVCIDPFIICKDFLVKIAAVDLARLGLKDPKDALVLSFVTVRENPRDNTANLLAPVIINLQNRTGKQIILEDFPVKFNIWDNLDDQSEGDGSC